MTHLTVNSNCLNELTALPLNRLIALKELVIGDNSLNGLSALRLDGLSGLERVVVGSNSFKNSDNNSELVVRGCSALRSVTLGSNSFASFGVMEIERVPLLEELSVGDGCLKNVDALRLNGLNGLKRVVVGSSSFSNKNGAFSVVNCTSLESVEIGSSSMGAYSVLSVDNTPSLEVLSIGSNAFKNVDALRLNGLSKLKKVEISADSFTNIKLGSFQVQTYSIKEFLVVSDVTLFEFFVSEVGKCQASSVTFSMYGAPSFTGCLSNPL